VKVTGRKKAPGLRMNEDETKGRDSAGTAGGNLALGGTLYIPPDTPSDASWSSPGRPSRAGGLLLTMGKM